MSYVVGKKVYSSSGTLQNFSNILCKLKRSYYKVLSFQLCYLIWWLNILWIFYNKINKFLSTYFFGKSQWTIE